MQDSKSIIKGLSFVLSSLKSNYPELEPAVMETIKSCKECLQTGKNAEVTSLLRAFAETANKTIKSSNLEQNQSCFDLLEKLSSMPDGILSGEQEDKIISLQRSIRVGDTDLSKIMNGVGGLIDEISGSIGVLKEKNYGDSKVKGNNFQDGVKDVMHADLAVATRRIGRDLNRLTSQLISQYPDDPSIQDLQSEVNDLGEGSAKFFKGIDLLSRISWALNGINEKQMGADKAYVGKLAEQFKDMASVCNQQISVNDGSKERLSKFENEFNRCIKQLENAGNNSKNIVELKSKILENMANMQKEMASFIEDQNTLISSQNNLIVEQVSKVKSMEEDATNLNEQLAVANKAVSEDALTGIPNRRGYDEHMENMFNLFKINKEKVGLILIDIDHFKKINDTYGHNVGDEVLVHIAGVLKRVDSKYKTAHVSRFGGEEFAVIVNNMAPKEVLAIARSINAFIAKHPYVNKEAGLSIPLTASAGVSVFLDKTDTPDIIFEGADKALYKAKDSGRNCVWIFKAREIERKYSEEKARKVK